MGEIDTPGIGELSRQVRDVLVRFEGLATRLETQFVRNDNFNLYKQLVDQAIFNLQGTVAAMARADKLADVEGDMAKKADVNYVTGLNKRVDTKAGKDVVDALVKRVDDLEDDRKWLIRLVIGFIILAVLGAVFAVSQGAG